MKWRFDDLDLADRLNHDIWRDSPGVQVRLDPPRQGREGDVGAAQAMVGPIALPWVPDLVGRSWRKPGSVLVFGSSYADFFSRFAARARRFAGHAYTPATPVAEFQRTFVNNVVDDDPSYYGKVLELFAAANVPLNRIVLTDLCRASFVAIRNGRADSSEQVLVDQAGRFNGYVAANTPWHAHRLDGLGGTVIVALGQLAMRGVLHLLGEGLGDNSSWLLPSRPPVLATRKRGEREFHVLCVPHPGARRRRPADAANRLRSILDRDPVGGVVDIHTHEAVQVRRAKPVEQPSPGSGALWHEALREARPLEAARLLARDPRSPELTATLLDRVTAERVVAIANAMFNPCRPDNLRKSGKAVTPQEAWRILLERRDVPYSRAGSKWERLVGALRPIPLWAEERVRAMDIERLGALSAALIAGPYRRM